MELGASAGPHKQDPQIKFELRVHDGDPLVGRAYDSQRLWPKVRLLLLVPAVLCISAIAAAPDHGLFPALGFGQLPQDIGVFLGHRHPKHPDYVFPLLRDYAALTFAAAGFLSMRIGYWQWNCLRRFLPDLQTVGAIEIVEPEKFSAGVDETNERFKTVARGTVWFAIAAIILAFAIFFSQNSGGIYGRLAGSGADHRVFANMAKEHWWATVDNPLGFMCYLTLLGIGLYGILRLNVVGGVFLQFWFKWRGAYKFRWVPSEPQGFAGYVGLRRGLMTVFLLVTVDLASLIAISLAIVPLGRTWLVPFFAVFLLLAPAYLAFPMWLYYRSIQPHRKDELKRINDELARLEAEPELGRLEYIAALRAHARTVRQVPRLPFRWPRLLAAAFVYVATVVGTGVTIVSTFK